jgi:tRNA G18 (ribose-2'-O)-methylase SpoU
LSADLRRACASAALIPMLGTAESLNLAVASAIMLYAAERAQR